MNKIIVIGCPGSGKSTFSIKLAEMLNYPVLHIDKIYHIDNETNIGREELIKQTILFAENNGKWIIDGNYKGTIDLRIDLCDTIVLFNIDTNSCLKNVRHRSEHGRVAMAENFDVTKTDHNFIDFIKEFKESHYPVIIQKAKASNKHLVIFDNYDEMNSFIDELK